MTIKDCLVVGIWNAQEMRHAEYFPQKPFKSMKTKDQQRVYNTKSYGGQAIFAGKIVSDNYLKFIVEELKPAIDSLYPTLSDRDNTYMAGSSMGGLISMYSFCEYPGIFGGVACLSTHWPGVFEMADNPIPGAFVKYLKQYLPDPETHKIYFDYGTETLDAWYTPYQMRVDQVMGEKGYTSTSWVTREFPGHDHSEKSWNQRLSIPILFLLGKDE